MRQLKITTQITSRDSEALEKYLQAISKIPMIDQDTEVILAKRIQQGDQEALERLTEANLRFVVSVAKKYQHQGLPLGDLIDEGNLGLIKAAQRFDATRGFKFISYAVWWIRQSILHALAESGRMVRLPQNRIGIYNKITRATNAFEQENEREPTVDEISEIIEIDEYEIQEIIKTNTWHTSLDSPVLETEDVTLGDIIPTQENTDDSLNKDSLQKEISNILKMLKPREAEIISAYFGLEGAYGPTLEQVGQKHNLTKERIRQIKERVIKRLQQSSARNLLKKYLG